MVTMDVDPIWPNLYNRWKLSQIKITERTGSELLKIGADVTFSLSLYKQTMFSFNVVLPLFQISL